MSHDIRTPMNAIIGFTDLALEDLSNEEQVRECLERIQSSGDHLLMLINDVLDMSRIESGKIVVEPAECNIKELVGNMCQMLLSQIEEKQLNLTFDASGVTDVFVMCDKLRINQILLNCVGNSIKFTEPGGHIGVLVEQLPGDEPGQGIYSFILSDTGIGMSADFVAHMFEAFERERSSTISRIQGNGLGMTITKNLVEMMNGTIDVESREGEGTTYVINIPFEIVDRKPEEIEEEQECLDVSQEEMEEYLKGKHFLLVDDNKTNRLLAAGVLKAKGMTTEEAEDGSQAVSRIRLSYPGEFDMVLMDIQMPVMGGYEATDEIRSLSDPFLSTIPILAMTANAFEEDKQECLAHGMNGHIAKPYKADDLVRKMYECIFE